MSSEATGLVEPAPQQSTLLQDLRDLLNRHTAENGSDTPDFILAEFMLDSLRVFESAIYERERWYGRSIGIPSSVVVVTPATGGDAKGDQQ